ncbi:MAG: FAD-binding protein [Candidatus Bipolaricaulota bacterium]|nr:FAD-binding protein [Candidatus Bipolaricaulota bacterium]
MNYSTIDSDVLIIGAGGGGLRAALELDRTSLDVLVVGKREFGDAHTVKAAGGINASFGNLDPEDNWKIHAADTLREGGFINDPRAVELLCKKVPDRVKELREWGCNFNLTDSGSIDQRYFGAQSFRRTCFVGDRTGKAIEATLVDAIKGTNVARKQEVVVTKILTEEGRAIGAVGYDKKSSELLLFKVKAVLLAAGGYTQIYSRSSSRPHENTGDGPALAFDAGARLQDMEMVQFHPTGMVKPEEKLGSLVTEAVRGEGGKLFNTNDDRFMERYSPQKMELDARDKVARAIYREIEKGNGTEAGGVYLDISHEDSESVRERIPGIVEKFREVGVDPTSERMEVAPTTHYSMGGVKINFETGKTAVEGLFAVGEVTAGLHGANRLGGNSLAEVVTFGQHVAVALKEYAKSVSNPSAPEAMIKSGLAEIEDIRDGGGDNDPGELMDELGRVLWKHAGIVRTEEGLKQGLTRILNLRERANHIKAVDKINSERFDRAVELKFALPVAESVVRSAIAREESRGAHYRDDHRERLVDWKKNIEVMGSPEHPELKMRNVEKIPDTIKQALKEGYELDYHHLE